VLQPDAILISNNVKKKITKPTSINPKIERPSAGGFKYASRIASHAPGAAPATPVTAGQNMSLNLLRGSVANMWARSLVSRVTCVGRAGISSAGYPRVAVFRRAGVPVSTAGDLGAAGRSASISDGFDFGSEVPESTSGMPVTDAAMSDIAQLLFGSFVGAAVFFLVCLRILYNTV